MAISQKIAKIRNKFVDFFKKFKAFCYQTEEPWSIYWANNSVNHVLKSQNIEKKKKINGIFWKFSVFFYQI